MKYKLKEVAIAIDTIDYVTGICFLMGVALVTKHVMKEEQGNAVLAVHFTVKAI